MKKYKPFITGGVISILFILITITILVSSQNIESIYNIAFLFHRIPFKIAFSGGSPVLIILYYFTLWIVLTLILSFIYLLIVKLNENSKK